MRSMLMTCLLLLTGCEAMHSMTTASQARVQPERKIRVCRGEPAHFTCTSVSVGQSEAFLRSISRSSMQSGMRQ
jgi:hypothetical protein